MRTFAAEVYAPGGPGADVGALAERAAAACRALAAEGVSVRYLSSVLMPSDEICIQVFSADSASVVDAVARQAGLRFARVTEAVTP
jgi:hypothetical protein